MDGAVQRRAREAQELRRALGLYSDREVAAILGIELATLRNRRSQGLAPTSSKVGAEHLTSEADLRAFLARRRTAQRAA